MIVREIEHRGGVRTERLVDYATGRVVSQAPPRERIADAWVEHWSQSMGARTPQHGREIADRCRAVGLDVKFEFGTHGRLKVDGRPHQKKLMPVAHADRGRMVNFDDY